VVALDYAARARALVGTRFRPQGRSADGLDCVGLVLATFGLATGTVRRNYSLKGDHEAEVRRGLAAHFREIGVRKLREGDVMLMNVAENQVHLAVRTATGFVHAHAGIGRVVETPGLPDWPLLAVYRKRRSR
jgi:cell wall-associated NlpC family hydrolase